MGKGLDPLVGSRHQVGTEHGKVGPSLDPQVMGRSKGAGRQVRSCIETEDIRQRAIRGICVHKGDTGWVK